MRSIFKIINPLNQPIDVILENTLTLRVSVFKLY